LNDHLDRGTARLDAIDHLVLDEADRMLDMGFKPQLDRILAKVPGSARRCSFRHHGAEVAQFAQKHLRNPVRVEVARSGAVAERASQQVFLVGQEERSRCCSPCSSRTRSPRWCSRERSAARIGWQRPFRAPDTRWR